MRLRRGEIIELTVEKFADQGKSLARRNGYVVFIPWAVPGDRVRARVYKAKKSYAEAHIEEVLEPSALRIEPRCFYFGTCGGCRWQHVEYRAQLRAKTDAVRDALVHTGGFQEVDVRPAIPAEKVYFYRNKMEFSFSAARWLTRDEIDSSEVFDTGFALGLHVPGSFDKVLDLHECHLQSDVSVRIVNSVRAFAKEHEWKPWDVKRHSGFLRHLVIRSGERTGDLMVNLVTSAFDDGRMDLLSERFRTDVPEVTTFVNTINTTPAHTSHGQEMRTIFGPGVLRERIGPHTFEIGPNAFFQTNTVQTERLYEITREFAEIESSDVVYDLYCGAGTISLFVAAAARHVVGVEVVAEAVANANANAAANGVGNCTFVAGDVLELFNAGLIERHGAADVLIVDPPRAGIHPKVVEQIASTGADRFVYVSCNPQTQARDLGMLSSVYQITAVQPVDLFPQTHHVEAVVKLVRRG